MSTSPKRSKPAAAMAPTVTTHVVLFKMKDTFTSEVEANAATECGKFVGTIPGVLSATFGRTFTTEHAHDFTHCLVVTFEHPSFLSGYGPHDQHQKWANEFASHRTDILKVDIDAVVHASKI